MNAITIFSTLLKMSNTPGTNIANGRYRCGYQLTSPPVCGRFQTRGTNFYRDSNTGIDIVLCDGVCVLVIWCVMYVCLCSCLFVCLWLYVVCFCGCVFAFVCGSMCLWLYILVCFCLCLCQTLFCVCLCSCVCVDNNNSYIFCFFHTLFSDICCSSSFFFLLFSVLSSIFGYLFSVLFFYFSVPIFLPISFYLPFSWFIFYSITTKTDNFLNTQTFFDSTNKYLSHILVSKMDKKIRMRNYVL